MPFKDYNVAAEESVRDAFNSPTTELRFFEKVVDLFPRTILAGDADGPVEALMLSLNSFQLLLAGGRIALTGHASAMFPVVRTALESACYAFMILEARARGCVESAPRIQIQDGQVPQYLRKRH